MSDTKNQKKTYMKEHVTYVCLDIDFCKEFQDLPQPKKDIQATPGAATDCKQTHHGEQEVNAHLGMVISCGTFFFDYPPGNEHIPPW